VPAGPARHCPAVVTETHAVRPITIGEIKKFEIWLSKIPARGTIVEYDDGKLVLNIKEKGGQRSIEAINRPVEFLRTVLNYGGLNWLLFQGWLKRD
jgi:hypothetical protein